MIYTIEGFRKSNWIIDIIFQCFDLLPGDSGGPLVCQRCTHCEWYLVGITSFGVRCAEPNFPTVYAEVAAYEDWIQAKIDFDIPNLGQCVRPGKILFCACIPSLVSYINDPDPHISHLKEKKQ